MVLFSDFSVRGAPLLSRGATNMIPDECENIPELYVPGPDDLGRSS
jgi:hypothetical protein